VSKNNPVIEPADSIPVNDTSFKMVLYKGYQSGRKPSEVSGLPRLYYDRTKPFEKEIPIYNFYKVTSVIKKPKAYIIPQGWWKVIDRLKKEEQFNPWITR